MPSKSDIPLLLFLFTFCTFADCAFCMDEACSACSFLKIKIDYFAEKINFQKLIQAILTKKYLTNILKNIGILVITTETNETNKTNESNPNKPTQFIQLNIDTIDDLKIFYGELWGLFIKCQQNGCCSNAIPFDTNCHECIKARDINEYKYLSSSAEPRIATELAEYIEDLMQQIN